MTTLKIIYSIIYQYKGHFMIIWWNQMIRIQLIQMGNKINFQQIRKETITKRDQSLQKYLPIFASILTDNNLTAQQIKIVINADLPTLVKLLNNREVSSLTLVAIFGQRAATIGKKLGCITEDYFQFALKKSQQCDDERKSSKRRNWTFEDDYDSQKYLPPLFGIPISIKDNIQLKGTRSTVGLTARANIFIQQDCGIMLCVKNSGMIPFVKTNVPQITLNFDTYNFLWGRCLNPWNVSKSAGGSSGGEGALVAAKISPIGIGNDIFGSVRIPAAFNGVVGFMVSPGRLPLMDTVTPYNKSFGGMDTVKNITGPLTKSVESAALWVKAMTTESYYNGNHDPYIKLIPFDSNKYKQVSISRKKLRIGYIQSFELIETSPAVNRGLLQTIQFLKSEGHQLVEIHLPSQKDTLFVPYFQVISEGNMATFTELLQGQKLVPQYDNFLKISSMNKWLFAGIKFLMNKLQPRVGKILSACQRLDTHGYLQKIGRTYEVRKEWIDYWRKNQLDYVICPGFAIQAPDHGFSKECSLVAAYTYIWNVLGMTSCSLPVTVTRQDEQYYQSHWEDDFTKAIKKSVANSAGMPVSIQVVGLPFHEEGVLGLAKKIQSHFQFYTKHPLPNVQN